MQKGGNYLYEDFVVKLPSFLPFFFFLIALRSHVCELQQPCSSEINNEIVLWFRFCHRRTSLKFRVFYLLVSNTNMTKQWRFMLQNT